MMWCQRRVELRTRPLDRLVLRRAAQRYAGQGWDVVPGACLSGAQFYCDEMGCPTTACHPALADWEAAASHCRDRVDAWWGRLHHGVLLVTGRAFDVLEIGDPWGEVIAAQADGPVAVSPAGRWMFLVRPGAPLSRDLADHSGVVLHGKGSWIPAPPTRLPDGRVRWRVAPDRSDWRPGDPYLVQQLATRALDGRVDQAC